MLPQILWCELDSHGYNIVDITPDRLQVEYWLVDTVLQPSNCETLGAVWKVDSGTVHASRLQ